MKHYPMARSNDPNTSHQAAIKHTNTNLSIRREQIISLVRDHPGCTSGELSRFMLQKHMDLPLRTIAETPHKRLPELEKIGLVRRGNPKKCNDSSHLATTWWPTPQQEDLF